MLLCNDLKDYTSSLIKEVPSLSQQIEDYIKKLEKARNTFASTKVDANKTENADTAIKILNNTITINNRLYC